MKLKLTIISILFLSMIVIVFSNHFLQYSKIYDWMDDNDYVISEYNIHGVYFENLQNDNGYFKRVTIYAKSNEDNEEEHLFIYSYSSSEKIIFHKDNIDPEDTSFNHYKNAVRQENVINPLLNVPFWRVIGYIGVFGASVSIIVSLAYYYRTKKVYKE